MKRYQTIIAVFTAAAFMAAPVFAQESQENLATDMTADQKHIQIKSFVKTAYGAWKEMWA